MTHGGPRPGAGRPKGAKTKITEEALKRAAEGETPLEYMLRVMRDDGVPSERRDEMALAAAPYVHAKLSQVETKGETIVRTVSAEPVSAEQWQQQHAAPAQPLN